MTFTYLIIWIVAGSVLGLVVNMIMDFNWKPGMLLNIIAGIAGAILSGLVFSPLIDMGTINNGDFRISALFISLFGAILLLAFVTVIRHEYAQRA